MSDVWYYRKNDEQHGPVTSSELKQLAASGKLLPVDHVQKEGTEKWQPASRVKGLTFGEPPTEDASPTQLKDELNRLAVTTRSAGSLVTKQTTKTKLVNVTLPKAYRALGEEIYGKSEHREEFSALYVGIDEVNQTLSQLSNKPSEASLDETLSGKANALFDSAKRGVNRTVVEQRRSKLLGDLGRAAYEKYGASAGANGPVIKETLSQIELLGTETAELSKSSSDGLTHAMKNPLVVGLSLLLCFPLGLFLVWRHPVWSRNQKLVWTGALCGLIVLGAMLPDDEVVTEDFLPHKEGARAVYYIEVIPPGEDPVVMKDVYDFGPDGSIRRSTESIGRIQDGEFISSKFVNERLSDGGRRVRAGFIESLVGDEGVWQKELKLGAKPGDSWTGIPDHSEVQVADFATYTIQYDGTRRPSVEISEQMTAGSLTTISRATYVKDIGLVEKDVYKVLPDGTEEPIARWRLEIPDPNWNLIESERLMFE